MNVNVKDNDKNLIYGLRDPRTDEYWYVGKSAQGLSRPRAHFTHSHNDLVNEWISGLKDDNLIPTIDVFEVCDDWKNLLDKEKFWIKKYLKENHPLCNIVVDNDTFALREKIKILKQQLMDEEERLDRELKNITGKYIDISTVDNIGGLGKLVHDLRKKECGLSRDSLAIIAGVGKTFIYDIEHGKETCRMSSVLSVLRVLNIKVRLISPLDHKSEPKRRENGKKDHSNDPNTSHTVMLWPVP